MKILFYLAYILLLPLYSNLTNPIKMDCSELKNGHFHYFMKLTKERVEIERRDSLQISIRADGQELRSKILWNDDCSYYVFMNAFSTTKLSFQDSIISTLPIKFKINAIEKDYYICTGTIESPGMQMEIRDTIYFN